MTTSITDVLSKIGFTDEEKELFNNCLEMIRQDQLEGTDSTAALIEAVKEVETDED